MPSHYGETFVLVEFLIDLQFQALPPEVVETAKLCLLDTLGAGLYASQTPWAKKAAQVAIDVGEKENVLSGADLTRQRRR